MRYIPFSSMTGEPERKLISQKWDKIIKKYIVFHSSRFALLFCLIAFNKYANSKQRHPFNIFYFLTKTEITNTFCHDLLDT